VESLAFSLGVSVVTSIDLTVAKEGSLRNLGVDGVVLAGNARNTALQRRKSIIARRFVAGEGGVGGFVDGGSVGTGGLVGGSGLLAASPLTG